MIKLFCYDGESTKGASFKESRRRWKCGIDTFREKHSGACGRTPSIVLVIRTARSSRKDVIERVDFSANLGGIAEDNISSQALGRNVFCFSWGKPLLIKTVNYKNHILYGGMILC